MTRRALVLFLSGLSPCPWYWEEIWEFSAISWVNFLLIVKLSVYEDCTMKDLKANLKIFRMRKDQHEDKSMPSYNALLERKRHN